MLSYEEMERYDRQLMIPQIGAAGQEKIKQTRVLVAGAGGLGTPVTNYLVAAGFGLVRIVDDGSVELSNLNRQTLHWETDVGKRKVNSAASKLRKLNNRVSIEAVAERITVANAAKLVADCDAIVDCLDNLETRYVLNQAALEHGLPYFHGAVYGFEGRAMTVLPGQTACLKCVYRTDLPQEKTPVVGITPGIIGCIQVAELMKYVVGTGSLLVNRILVFDALSMKFSELKVKRDPDCSHCSKYL
jgi:molybdopterin/thiamine biosynthesis adenylyltransferase